MNKVLIVGGTGFIGSYMSVYLAQKGYKVFILSTRKNLKIPSVSTFYWNPKLKKIDMEAFRGVKVILNLCGANIFEKRWTKNRKELLRNSRIESTRFLVSCINQCDWIEKVIFISAIGIYKPSSSLSNENSEKGDNFLSKLCIDWEEASLQLSSNISRVVFRLGVVFSYKGSALQEFQRFLPFFVPILGNGNQYVSWIHIEDVCGIFLHSMLNKEIQGTYNAVSPRAITLKSISKQIAVLRRTLILKIPEKLIKTILGERSQMILNSYNCSSSKLLATQYDFKFSNFQEISNKIKP